MEYKAFKDIKLSRLGMGNMRLPSKKDENGNDIIDYEKSKEIIDYAMSHGVNYYDTAYVYNNGGSERFLGEAMKSYPRDSFYLATKFFILANPDYKAVFEEELKRLQTDHIDFYLMHCLMDGNVDKYLASGAIEYFQQLKKEGKIRYLGFSSHAGLAALEKFADAADWDFAQLQINYYDWNYAETQKEYQILADRHIPTMVMEPVRGGRLASLTPEAEKLLKDAHPDWSIASWALRFVRTLNNAQVILSGMSDLNQITDNIKTFSDDYVLTEEDKAILFKACDLFHSQVVVPCTSCRYCCDNCPMQINIPEWMKLYNNYKLQGAWALQDAPMIESEGKPQDCIGCGSCMNHCPQSISIPDIMAELAEVLK